MLDISLQNFEADVIKASQQHPVLLDIWAPWCGPCKALGPVLEKLEVAYAGRFSLAKLNSDDQPEIAGQLSQMFGVRSIPFCVLFKDGQPVDGFVGALPEGDVRTFLDRHVPTTAELEAEADILEAEHLLAEGDAAKAIEKLRDAVAINPDDDTARYEYLYALLAEGRFDDARAAFEPVSKRVVLDPRLVACRHWLEAAAAAKRARPIHELVSLLQAYKRNFDARFELAQVHLAAQRFTDALDELLEILARDKNWRDGTARLLFVSILELMCRCQDPVGNNVTSTGEDATSSNLLKPYVNVQYMYRRKLSMTLF